MQQQTLPDNEIIPETAYRQQIWNDQSDGTVSSPTATYTPERRAVIAGMTSTFLLRLTNRISFVILSFYLGAQFSSAALIGLILESFYISELLLAPLVGTLSDRWGRKPFLILAPICGGCANLCLLTATLLFPHPQTPVFNGTLLMLLLLILGGRLFEGTTTALNTPASLGYLSDITSGTPRRRARIMTLFEIVTMAGIAAGIPLGGHIGGEFGNTGFFLIIALHLLNIFLIAFCVREPPHHTNTTKRYISLLTGLHLLRERHVYTFLPAWFAINALIGSWMSLIIIVLTYPINKANKMHSDQFLYGGFSKGFATLLLGGFGLVFLAGMLIWAILLPRLRRTTVMLIGLAGLAICIMALSLINGLPGRIETLTATTKFMLILLVPLVASGAVMLSGFTPAALTQMAAIADVQPDKKGAVMGLYSLVLALAQLAGASLGGLAIDQGGFYGLMIFSGLLAFLSFISVSYMRIHT